MSNETRTTSSTGGEKGMKPERHDLIPREGLEAIARVYAFGAEKYADHNWRKGYEWSKSYAALQRHLVAFWSGETIDQESGLPHLAHAGFHIMALLTWLEQDGEGSQFDDRYRPPVTPGSEWEEAGYVDETLLPDGGFTVAWNSPAPRHSEAVIQAIRAARDAVQRSFDPFGVVHSSDIPTEDLRM